MYKADYERSLEQEKRFEAYIKSKYKLLTESSQSKGYFPDWDISTTGTGKHAGKVTTFEVKLNDNYKQNTIVIETCKIVDEVKHPSGLSLTNSDYYVLCFPNDDNWYIINTNLLKQLVDDLQSKKYIIYDKNNYQLHIFDKPWLLNHCKAI